MIEANQLTRAMARRLYGALGGRTEIDMFLRMSFWHDDEGIHRQRSAPHPSLACSECVEFANLADWFVEVPLP